MRKTFEILPIIEYANTQLSRSDEYATEDFKQGICAMIEKLLLSANCYYGFRFLLEEKTGAEISYSSRFYYPHPKLS